MKRSPRVARLSVPVALDSFCCPECGSHEVANEWKMSPRPGARSAWQRVGWIILCGGCGVQVPAAVGRLGRERTPEEARSEWQQLYRARAVDLRSQGLQ